MQVPNPRNPGQRAQHRSQRAPWRMPLLVATVSAALTACGGGTTPEAPMLRGWAVDGYLQQATVFLDLNANGVRDGAEPSASTDERGRFALAVGAVPASALQAASLVATGGTDADTGYAFTGRLVAAVDTAAELQGLSPLATVAHAMVRDGVVITPAQAWQHIAQALGAGDVARLQQDPVALADSDPAALARQVATQRALQMLASAFPEADSASATRQAASLLGGQFARSARAGRILASVADAIPDTVQWDTATSGVSMLKAATPQLASRSVNTSLTKGLAEALEYAMGVALKPAADRSARVRTVTRAFDLLRVKAQATTSKSATLASLAAALDSQYGSTDAFAALVRAKGARSVAAIEGALVRLQPVLAPSGAGSTGSSSAGTPPAPAPASSAGRLLASNCFQCHGTEGRGGFDAIRGKDATEVFEFLAQPAASSIMAAHAQGYTRAQLDAIVNYLKQ